jgi:adenylosuccinate synthase
VVDYLSDRFEAVARYNGGSNAGHTVVVGGNRYRFHLVPSGAVKGKKLLIGAGVALDPVILKGELELLSNMGVGADLLVDGRCSLVSPLEKEFDGFLERLRGASAIGTTRMGIGPAYAARALRMSPRAMDLFSRRFDFQHMLRFYRGVLGKRADLKPWLRLARTLLRTRLGDVSAAVSSINEGGGAVLFEGAHGAMLDLQHGTYPYVTSSSTISSYAPTGLGLPPGATKNVIGVTKAYATRVGAGPFPSERRGRLADKIREVGKEFGTTTGRPRRIGWLDLVALKYAVRMNGAAELALSKIDVLSKVRNPQVCVAYSLAGSESDDFYRFMGNLDGVRPVYHTLPSFYGAEFRDGIPSAARKLIDTIEHTTGATVKLLSYGEERRRTVEL